MDDQIKARLRELPRRERARRFYSRHWKYHTRKEKLTNPVGYMRRQRRIKAWRAEHEAYLAALHAAIPELTFTSFGGAAPCQGWGTLGDRFVYYRFRHNIASLETYASEDVYETRMFDGADSVSVIEEVLPGDDFAGHELPLDEQIELLRRLIDGLRPHDSVDNPTGVERLAAAVENLLAGQPLTEEPEDAN